VKPQDARLQKITADQSADPSDALDIAGVISLLSINVVSAIVCNLKSVLGSELAKYAELLCKSTVKSVPSDKSATRNAPSVIVIVYRSSVSPLSYECHAASVG